MGNRRRSLPAEHVYLTASEGKGRLTLCLDLATGRELWRREITPVRQQKNFHDNDPASPTAAADQDGVVVFFADFGLVAYTPEGKDRWTLPLGPFKSFYGMAASPVITGDLVVLLCDQRSGSFLIALDRKTGQLRWRRDRPQAVEGWATPMVFRPGTGQAASELVVLGSTRLDAYAPETGEPRWWMPLGSTGSMGTVVASGETLFLSTADPPNRRCRPSPRTWRGSTRTRIAGCRRRSSASTRTWASTSAGSTPTATASSPRPSGTRPETSPSATTAQSPSVRPAPRANWARPPFSGASRRTCRISRLR